MLNPDYDDVETVEDLTRPEHLLVWSMRVIALGHEECPLLSRAFQQMCGVHGLQALQTHLIFVKYVAMTAERRLQVHVPGCICLGSDEAAALAVVAAAQQSIRDRDEGGLRQALRELTGPRADESLILVAQALARLLDASGLVLPSREPASFQSRPTPTLAVANLH